MPRCPCCGAPVDYDDFLVDLNTNEITYRGQTIKTRWPQHAELLYLLRKKWPDITPHDDLIRGMWGGNEPQNPQNIIKTRVSQVRKDLEPLGIEIRARWGEGYYLVLPA